MSLIVVGREPRRDIPNRRACAVTATVLPVFHAISLVGKSPAKLSKLHKLIRGEYLPHREFIFKSQPRNVSLGRAKLAQARLEVSIGNGVCIDRHIEITIGFTETLLRLHHLRPTLLVHTTELLHLLARQSELSEKVWPTVVRPFVRRVPFGRWPILAKSSCRDSSDRCHDQECKLQVFHLNDRASRSFPHLQKVLLAEGKYPRPRPDHSGSGPLA